MKYLGESQLDARWWNAGGTLVERWWNAGGQNLQSTSDLGLPPKYLQRAALIGEIINIWFGTF